MKKLLYFIIIIIILAGGYYFYARRNRQAVAPTVENGAATEKKAEESQNQPSAASSSAKSSAPGQGSGTQPSQGIFSAGEGEAGPDILVVRVDYDGQSFNPKSIDIKVGDIVIFKNNSSQNFWPASNPHPIHTDYPEFDAKQAIAPGGKYQFKFEKAGNWGYHDHLNPGAQGNVNVAAK